MELLLIRHALPVRRELESGAADPELSADGVAQAQHLAAYLAPEHLDAVYASSMQRARQTAVPVATTRDLEVIVRDGITEFDRFSSDYVPVEELKAANDPRWQQMLDGVWDGDESREAFTDRTITAIEEIIATHAGQRVAVVCHGGVINAYLGAIMGVARDGDTAAVGAGAGGGGGGGRGFFYPNYTSIHRVAASSRGDRSVITINETSHLRNTGLPMGLFQKG